MEEEKMESGEEEEGGISIFVETLNYSLLSHSDYLHRNSIPEPARNLIGYSSLFLFILLFI